MCIKSQRVVRNGAILSSCTSLAAPQILRTSRSPAPTRCPRSRAVRQQLLLLGRAQRRFQRSSFDRDSSMIFFWSLPRRTSPIISILSRRRRQRICRIVVKRSSSNLRPCQPSSSSPQARCRHKSLLGRMPTPLPPQSTSRSHSQLCPLSQPPALKSRRNPLRSSLVESLYRNLLPASYRSRQRCLPPSRSSLIPKQTAPVQPLAGRRPT